MFQTGNAVAQRRLSEAVPGFCVLSTASLHIERHGSLTRNVTTRPRVQAAWRSIACLKTPSENVLQDAALMVVEIHVSNENNICTEDFNGLLLYFSVTLMISTRLFISI